MTNLEKIANKFGIKITNQYFIDIPDKGSYDLAALFAELGYTEGVEVGVLHGDFSKMLLEANPNLHLTSIDAWKAEEYPEGFLKQSHPRPGSDTQKYYDDAYQTATAKLAPFNCTVRRMTSMDAAKTFPDHSLDFVYLDAGHDFYNFTCDLHFWRPKVKIGGILAGHDYSKFKSHKFIHVREVLIAYAQSYKMHPYFVMPRTRNYPKRDLYGNWFWVKDHD